MYRFAPAALLVCLALTPTTLWAEGSDYEIGDPESVYFGDPATFEEPAELSLSDVFEHIAPYREILDRDLNEEDAEYWILLEKANRIFEEVLQTIAGQNGFDLIGEEGAIAPTGDSPAPPNVTDRASQLASAMGNSSVSAQG